MTDEPPTGDTILGSLSTAEGRGVVRVTDHFATEPDDLWSALTTPARLASWLGDVDGDLQAGGEFRARFFASGWEGTGRVQTCEPPRRFVVRTRDPDEPDEHRIEATLTADGHRTTLVVEERGMGPELLAAYGAGVQIHVEDLRAYLDGRERRDAQARWQELIPAYERLLAGG